MSKFDKLILKLVLGNSDNSFDFGDLVKILLALGFIERINGSHHIFTKNDVVEIINLQPKNSKAKSYQVKQVRELVLKYKIWQDGSEPE